MDQKIIAIIAVVVIAAVGVSAAYVLTADNGSKTNSNTDNTGTATVITDSASREVTVPDNLDNGIVAVGWNVLKVLSYFDAHEKVTEVDYQETQMALGSLQPHYYCYDMSKMKTHEDTTIGAFSEASIEKIANEKPSLVIMTTGVYEKYKISSDALAKACPLVVLNLNDMSNMFWEQQGTGLVLASSIQNSLHILGDVLKESDRDEAVIETINSTLNDIVAHKLTDTTNKVNLAGSQMAMGSGDLNLVFPMFHPLMLAGATNAASVYSMPPFYTEVSVETFTSTYQFDTLLYDPSAPQTLANPNDQAILEWLYGLQGTEDEKEIYIILTTALCGYEMNNVIADAYFVEAKIGGTITIDDMKSKMTVFYKSLYGDEVGSSLWDDLSETMGARGTSAGVYTGLWEQVKVGKTGDTYSFVAA